MQPLDPAPYIIAASFFGSILGYCAACIYFCRRMRRFEHESWRSARIFYDQLRQQEGGGR